jgi:hypothetical protein
MTNQKPIAPETEQQRTERIRAEERKAHAARTQEALRRRFGVDE